MAVTITQTDLERFFGVSNIQVWSDLENTGSADTDRITEACNIGMDKINDAFRLGPYTVPFEATSGTLYPVKDWMVKLAGAWLYFSRGKMDQAIDDRMEEIESNVWAETRAYLSGRRRLNALRAETMPTAPVIVE